MSHLCLLGVATLTLTSASFAGSDTNADLQARLEAAEARISELSAATNATWLNETRADEIRSLIKDVLADADTRASLQGSGSTAGYNNGFTIGSADGNWSMTINGLLQTRWSSVDNEQAPPATDGAQWGFDNRRSWLHFSGTIAGDYGYDVRHGWGPINTAADTTWANGSLSIGDGWGLTMGTMKFASSREALIDDQYQMALDRDVAYTVRQGVALDYSSDDLGFTFQLFNNAPAVPPAAAPVAGASFSSHTWNARLEYLVKGDWGQFSEFTSAEGGGEGTLVGFSYSGNDDGDVVGGVTDDQTTWNLDLQMQFGGSNLYVSYNDFSDSSDSGADDTDANRLQVMYGMYLDNGWEVYARWVDSDGTTAPFVAGGPVGPLDGSIVSIGVTNYLAGHNAKWTTEIQWDDSVVGANTDVTTISTQLQFYF